MSKRNITLKSATPLAEHVMFKGLYTRNNNVNGWQSFFAAVEKEFKEKYGQVEKDTIEQFQLEEINRILMWINHLLADRKYSRGDARAIEELMRAVTWHEIAGEEKFRERFKQTTGKKISPSRMGKYKEMVRVLDEQLKRGEGRNLSQASRVMMRKYRWTDKERKNFLEAFRQFQV
jgi:hypothetical protein